YRRGRIAEAEAELREALQLDPKDVVGYANLGLALKAQGKLEEALAALRRADELAPPGSPVALAIPGLVRRVRGQLVLAARLLAVLKGDDAPRDVAERLAFAELCYARGLHVASARLYAEALAADPKLADDRGAQHRYNAACAAALAGCGRAKDDPPP